MAADSSTLRVVMAQLDFLVGDIAGNVDKIIRAATEARDHLHADLIAFPELTLTGYPPEDLLLRPGFIRQVDQPCTVYVMKFGGLAPLSGVPCRLQTACGMPPWR